MKTYNPIQLLGNLLSVNSGLKTVTLLIGGVIPQKIGVSIWNISTYAAFGAFYINRENSCGSDHFGQTWHVSPRGALSNSERPKKRRISQEADHQKIIENLVFADILLYLVCVYLIYFWFSSTSQAMQVTPVAPMNGQGCHGRSQAPATFGASPHSIWNITPF